MEEISDEKINYDIVTGIPCFCQPRSYNGIVSLGRGVAASGILGLHYELNFGYIYHGIKGKTINAADLRLSMDGSYYNESKSVGYFNSVKYNAEYSRILGGFLFTYSVGRVLPNARLMFDIIGFGYSAGMLYLKNAFDFTPVVRDQSLLRGSGCLFPWG